jgi:diaminopimelate epimerase
MQSETVNICHRNFGVGADGILLVSKNINSNIDYKMSVINSDGSRASMCGNGLRCVCAYLVNFKNYHPEFTIASDSGNLEVVVKE